MRFVLSILGVQRQPLRRRHDGVPDHHSHLRHARSASRICRCACQQSTRRRKVKSTGRKIREMIKVISKIEFQQQSQRAVKASHASKVLSLIVARYAEHIGCAAPTTSHHAPALGQSSGAWPSSLAPSRIVVLSNEALGVRARSWCRELQLVGASSALAQRHEHAPTAPQARDAPAVVNVDASSGAEWKAHVRNADIIIDVCFDADSATTRDALAQVCIVVDRCAFLMMGAGRSDSCHRRRRQTRASTSDVDAVFARRTRSLFLCCCISFVLNAFDARRASRRRCSRAPSGCTRRSLSRSIVRRASTTTAARRTPTRCTTTSPLRRRPAASAAGCCRFPAPTTAANWSC